MSRQPTWDTACALQADMFRAAASAGGLDIQLVYFRGLGECRASSWVANSEQLAALMSAIDCRGGHTQIGKVLATRAGKAANSGCRRSFMSATPWRRRSTILCKAAGELGLLGVPVFMFQEGNDHVAENAYREIARLSRGAYCRFDTGAAHQLGELLRAVAGRGLRLRRHQGAHRAVEARGPRRTSPSGAAQIAMPLFLGLVVLVLALWALNIISKVDPKIGARVLKAGGGTLAIGFAAFLGLRGELGIAIPLGAFGLGLLGWLPFGASSFSARTQKSAGQASRVRTQFLEMELDHDTGAMRGRLIAGSHKGAELEHLDVNDAGRDARRDGRGEPRATRRVS